MKNIFIILLLLIVVSCNESSQKDILDDKYILAEIKFLDQLFTSELIVPTIEELDSTFLKRKNVINIYDTLLSFESIGVSHEAIGGLLEMDEKSHFNFGLQSKKANFNRSPEYMLNIIEYDKSNVKFENSYYKVSRVSFNELYDEALVAIELVCFDCGGLALYKFTKQKSGEWKMENLINIWIS